MLQIIQNISDLYKKTNFLVRKICGIETSIKNLEASGSGDALVANPLSQFASTTSLQLKNTISDETGSGALVFGTSPNITTPTGIVKGDVGLGNVDNTSDSAKPVSTAQQTALNLKADLAGAVFTGNVQVLTVPLTSTSATSKNYIDNLITGITWKNAVKCATTVDIVLSGTTNIDGVTIPSGTRILVKNQTDQKENGVWVSAAGAWTRATDVDSGSEIETATVAVTNGTVNKNTQWTCTATGIIIGTTNITFGQISGAGTYTNGTGINLSANVFSIDGTVATLSGTQTLTNKTISQSQITNLTSDLALKLNKAGDIITGDIGNTATGFFQIPSGTTAQRPVAPVEGMRRYNTTTLRDEFYANGAWQNHSRLSGDTFTGAIAASNLSGTNTGDNATNTLYSGLVSNATHTGDATGATALTLATVNSNVGSFGGATAVPAITVNGKGLVTGVTSTSIQIAESQVTSLVSDLALKAPLISPSFTTPVLGVASATSQTVTGTGGNGFVELGTQSSSPSSPSSGTRLYSNSNSKLTWRGSVNTFEKTFDGSAATANRTYSLPDVTGTMTVLGNTSTGSGNIVLDTSPTIATPIVTTSAVIPITIGGTGTTSTKIIRSTSGVGATGADIIFQTGNNGATEAMRILNSGNVGIGAAPLGKLDVSGSSASTDLVTFDANRSVSVINTNTTTNNAEGVVLRSQSTNGTVQSGVKLMGVNTARSTTGLTTDLAILTNADGTITEKMRVTSSGLVGIGTSAPTHSLTFPSTSTGITLYNTSDQTTNYERVRQYWSGNVFNIFNEQGGTGTLRTIAIKGGLASSQLSIGNSSTGGGIYYFNNTGAYGTANGTVMGLSATATHLSGLSNLLSIFPTISQSSTAGYRGLWISPFESALGSGAKWLIDAGTNTAGVGGGTHTTQFGVANNGKITIATGSNKSIGTATLVAGTVTVSTTAVATGSKIQLTLNTAGGTLGISYAVPDASIVNGTSFVINSVSAAGVVVTTDTSSINWWIIN